jgi:hypothetical protein
MTWQEFKKNHGFIWIYMVLYEIIGKYVNAERLLTSECDVFSSVYW